MLKYDMIENITKAFELIELFDVDVKDTWEYKQLNKLFVNNNPQGLEEGKLFTKAELKELAEGLAKHIMNLQ